MKQKTWTDLLGKCNPETDSVFQTDIVRRLEGDHYRVLWHFDTEAEARTAYHWWWWGVRPPVAPLPPPQIIKTDVFHAELTRCLDALRNWKDGGEAQQFMQRLPERDAVSFWGRIKELDAILTFAAFTIETAPTALIVTDKSCPACGASPDEGCECPKETR